MIPVPLSAQTSIQTRFHLAEVIVDPATSIQSAMAQLDLAGTGALAICDAGRHLLGLVTDGDIRRALLRSRTLTEPCLSIATRPPVVAQVPVSDAEALRRMVEREINQLPLVDNAGVLVGFLLRRELAHMGVGGSTGALRLESAAIAPEATIAEAMEHLDRAGTGALILCHADRVLRGILTDGDIRRAVLQRLPMDLPCERIATRTPTVGPAHTSAAEALALMTRRDIDHLPILDHENRVIELLLRRDLAPDASLGLSAVIMAGGYGKRLYPLTKDVPKPMLPVGDRPLLELILQQMERSGIRDVHLATHYLPESITNHFGDGERFGVHLRYVREDRPMGTAGGLRQMPRPTGPFLVINGDVLTGAPFREMFSYHRRHKAVLTVGVRRHEVDVPYGVVECSDVHITGLKEKPRLGVFINAGAYLLEPEAWDHIPADRPFDMTDLIQTLLDAGYAVASFPITEYWIDIGRHEDYRRVQDDVLKGIIRI